MKTIQEYSGDSFTEYDDTVVRRLVECIKVSPDRTIEIILKDGIHGKKSKILDKPEQCDYNIDDST